MNRDLIAITLNRLPLTGISKTVLMDNIDEGFGVGYGAMGAAMIHGISEVYGLSIDDANDLYEALWDKYMHEKYPKAKN